MIEFQNYYKFHYLQNLFSNFFHSLTAPKPCLVYAGSEKEIKKHMYFEEKTYVFQSKNICIFIRKHMFLKIQMRFYKN